MVEITIVFVLLLISGAFSGTEVAFTSLSVDQIERLKKEHGRKGRLVARLHDRLDVVLSSITIGNNLANMIASALVAAFTIRVFGEKWLTVSTLVLTILGVDHCEVTPKQIGITHNDLVTLRMSPVLTFSRSSLPRLSGSFVRLVAHWHVFSVEPSAPALP